uniref:sperm-associated antigen 17 n=1 Tax=Monopterus albus TaxID=43700 RepID=UPI0009B415FA|nr:sperm-associated antigen 17 [Monopterus albus]
MAPKAAQKASVKKPSAAGAAAGNKNWEADLSTAPFEEDSWHTCVSLVVGRGPEEEALLRTLSSSVQQYRHFTLLTWDSTISKIQELGNPKAKKPDSVPVFYEVTERAKLLLDAGEEIPCDLMAKILKFQLLQVKASDRQRREAEQAKDEKAKGGPSSASKDKGGAKVPDRKGRTPLPPVGPSKEKKTSLKRRDEAEPPKYIDDKPDDGPQHYILVLGFHQPQLIGLLNDIGVHVANVIRVHSEHTQKEQHGCEGSEQSQTVSPGLDADSAGVELAAQACRLDLFWAGLRPVLDSAPPDSKLHSVAQLSYTVPLLSPSFSTQDPEAVREAGSQIFKGVASLIYDCLDWRRQHQHYLDSIKLINIPAAVGGDSQPLEVGPTLLPVTPLSKKKSVREQSPADRDAGLHPLSTHADMRYYKKLLDTIPPEASSVHLILHCMLEQVVISTEQPVSTQSHVAEKPRPQDGPWLDHELVSYMLQSFLPLVHTEEERSLMLSSLLSKVQAEEDKKRLVEKFRAEKSQKQLEHPQVVRHHDERALRLKDITAVQGFDPAEVELSMMRLTPVGDLIRSVQQRNGASCWMAVKQQLQHYCTDDAVSWPEVERLLHQSVFETMPLTGVDRHGVLLNTVRPPTAVPWDNPLSYAEQQLHNLRTKAIGPTFVTEDPGSTEPATGSVCSHLDLSDMQCCRQRSLFDWHYAEHHDASVFPQVLQLASEEYRCMDTFRGSHNNILYIFCHNPMSPHRQCKEFWDVALHTDVKFRTYLEHVAETISDWTREEELKREERQLRNLSLAEPSKDEKDSDATEEENALEPVIRKDSLKAWKLEQERLKEEEMARKSKKEDTPRGRLLREEDKKSKTLSSAKKSRAETDVSSAKTPVESTTTAAPPVEEATERHQTEEPFKGFTGYSMDGKLIHVSGRVQYLLPSDGGRITVENISYVEGSSLMKVAVSKDGHSFYTHINHVVVGPAKLPPQRQDNDTSDIKGDCKVSEPVDMNRVKQGSLSAVLDNGIHLSYSVYGPTGQYRASLQEAEGGIQEASTFVPSLSSSSSSPTHHSKRTGLDPSPSKRDTPATQSKVCEVQPAMPSAPFSSLHLSVPNGLLLQFLRDDAEGVSSEERGVLVRQSFPLHGGGEGRVLQDLSLSKELSRIVTSQGTVICYLRDGSAEVLFADGSVSFSQDCGPVWVPDSEVDTTPQKAKDDEKEQSLEKQANAQRGCWSTTTPSGARICTVGTTHQHIPTPSLLSFRATDPVTRQVMLSREDLVVSVQNPDGSLTVEHADGTRITSFYQDRPRHILLRAGEQPESVTPKSASECARGCTECVTCCADSISEKMHIQVTCDTEEEISGDPTGKECDEDAGRCIKLSECECVCDAKEHNSSEESVFAEETAAGNGKRRAYESDKESVSTKERVVLVEKEGCATVVVYPERHTAHVFLADGTVITGNNQGAYQVFPSSSGLLQIQSDGKCVYSSDSLVSPSSEGGTSIDRAGSYTMSHTDKVACDVTDPDGNHFQVMEDGQISVLDFSPAPSTLEPGEEEQEDGEMAGLHVKHREHYPRLFLMRADGSGTELLSSQTVEELLCQAYADPAIAVLKEPLLDTPDDFAITILKPSHQSVWSKWLLGKQNPDITPPNLRNRSWRDFPRVEKKVPGPPFGTDVGRGLTLRERPGGSAAQRQPVRTCPKVLEMRELYQHRAFTTALRHTVDTRLKEFIESLMERMQRSEEMKVKDPRTEEESVQASDLLRLVLSFAEEDDVGQTFDKATSESGHKMQDKNCEMDVASLYSRGVGASAEQSDISEDSAASDSFSSGKVSKWTERLAQHRQELSEDKACREALRKKNVVPYFHLENIPVYQSLLQHQTDMRSLSMELPPLPRPDSAETFLKDAPTENAPRSLNPTPSQSASRAAGSDRMPEKRPANPTPRTDGEGASKASPGPYKSLRVDVTGKPRRTKVRLPTSILSSKPCSVPNQQFLSVEEPVRRKCRTISLTDPSAIVRGFQLLPSKVDLGTLREGTSSAVTVVMKNVGVDTCRFHVKQPPPATGLRVLYNHGPVAAGLSVELQVQLFAQAGEVELRKSISQDITIYTETDILYLPVTANILCQEMFYFGGNRGLSF